MVKAYVLALALLLGVPCMAGTQAEAVARVNTRACAKVTPGATLYHARYAAAFLVVTVDPAKGRAVGTFPGTPRGDTQVPVQCYDLVRLEDLSK